MLFKNSSFTSKFCLVDLDDEERAEIASLITDNGGEISTTRKPPVMIFGNENTVCRAGEPIFHINFIRECVKHRRLLYLIDFIIGSRGYFGCLQCIFTSGEHTCKLHASNFKPPFTSTQINDRSQVNRANESSSTQMEHTYALKNAGDTQDANISVKKRSSNTKHVTEMLPRASSRSLTESQFLPLESQLENSSLVESSQGPDPSGVLESPRDSEFLPDESRQSTGPRLSSDSLNRSEDIFDKDTQVDGSQSEVLVPIQLQRFSTIENPNSDQQIMEVPEASSFEELEGDQEAESGVTSSRLTTATTPINDERVGGARTKEQLTDLEEFRLESSDSDDTDYEPNLSGREVLRTTTSTPSSKGKSGGKDNASKQTPSSNPSDIIDLTTEDEVIEASSGEENAGRIRCPRLDMAEIQNQPSTSRAERPAANDGRSVTVSSTRSEDSINDDSDTSFDEAEATAKRSNEARRTVGATQRIRRLPTLTRNILPWEQRLMVKYLVDNNYISDAKGLRVWKQMIEDGFLTHRTAQSLNNHFRRVILPTIHRFTMDRRSLKKFQRLQK